MKHGSPISYQRCFSEESTLPPDLANPTCLGAILSLIYREWFDLASKSKDMQANHQSMSAKHFLRTGLESIDGTGTRSSSWLN